MSKTIKGWLADDYAFEDMYDCCLNLLFEYKGKKYYLSCETDETLYDVETNEALWHFDGKDEFYTGVIFGRPIKDVIDDSYILRLG